MPPGYPHNPHSDDDDDDESTKTYPEHKDDRTLVPNTSSSLPNPTTLIPIPKTSYASTQSNKANIPPLFGPRNVLNRNPYTKDRNPEQQRKKRVSESGDLTSPNGKRPNMTNRRLGQEESYRETHDGGSHETNQTSPSGSNRKSTSVSMSAQLKQGLAGGLAHSNMKGVQELDSFCIPESHYQEWKKKNQARTRMSLDDSDSDDLEIDGEPKSVYPWTRPPPRMDNDLEPTQWEGGNTIHLTRFRRGQKVLDRNTGVPVSISLDDHGNVKVYEGGRDMGYGFPLKHVRRIVMNHTVDYVYITLGPHSNDIPSGHQIWWKLKEPCPDIDRRFFDHKDCKCECETRDSPWIEEKERQVSSLKIPSSPENTVYKAIQGYDKNAPQQKQPDTVDSKLSRETQKPRSTRSRKPEKIATSFNVGDYDAYAVSPTRPQFFMSKAERELPPLVWPPSGKKKVTVDYHDLERLEEEQFLNDNIINFYLRFLEEKLARDNPALAQQTHFFNTFFYERLSQKTGDKKANLQALMKWTARIDLFMKQYVIIPINENAHWYLVIICNLPHLEAQLQAIAGISHNEEYTTVSTPEEEVSSEVELPLEAETTTESPDRMDIDDPNQQRPATAEGQLLSELSNLESAQSANSPKPKDSEEPCSADEDEWPNEEGLEGISDQHIGVLKYSDIEEDSQEGDGEIIVNVDDPDKKPGKRQKEPLVKVKKTPNPVDPNAPTIFILDSLRPGLHPRTFSLLKEYLEEEASQKKGWKLTRADIHGVYARVPKQNNWCDCGVYLLCYVEAFLKLPKEFTKLFLERSDPYFDDESFNGMRVKLKNLISDLHQDQHSTRAENDVSNGCTVEVPTRKNSQRDASEEIQEVKHEGGGPCPAERSSGAKEISPKTEAIMALVNSIQSGEYTGGTPGPASSTQSSNIIQRRRYTPEPEKERGTSSGSTRSAHFSHVEISNKARPRTPPSLVSESSPEPTYPAEEWRAPQSVADISIKPG